MNNIIRNKIYHKDRIVIIKISHYRVLIENKKKKIKIY
jgi:hypothetical protein